MVNYIEASRTPAGQRLLALDAAGYFPNAVLHTGHGNGLDADTVDGTAEFNGNVLFKGGVGGQINGDRITDRTIDGTKCSGA